MRKTAATTSAINTKIAAQGGAKTTVTTANVTPYGTHPGYPPMDPALLKQLQQQWTQWYKAAVSTGTTSQKQQPGNEDVIVFTDISVRAVEGNTRYRVIQYERRASGLSTETVRGEFIKLEDAFKFCFWLRDEITLAALAGEGEKKSSKRG
jgi:hypothetical protein